MKKSFIAAIVILIVATSFATVFAHAQSPEERSNALSYEKVPVNGKILYYMEKTMGFRDPNKNYNIVIDSHGTGLAPPTLEEYGFVLQHAKFVKSVRNYRSRGSYDLSSSPYFPPVGDQGAQGSCAAWATAYYDNTFYQAKVHGWDDTHKGTNPHHIMSPAWTYNKANSGEDGGSSFFGNYMVMYTLGDASLGTMPYNPSDYTSWGTELAWREAPVGRIPDIEFTDVKNIDVIKSWIDQGYLATFAINANVYTSPDGAFKDGNYIVSWEEYEQFYGQPNHAQTIVGYDDSIEDDGDVGAFKVVNSWGGSFGDHGFYWLTYNAFSHFMFNYTYRIVGNEPNKPHLLGIWEFSNPGPRDAEIIVGIGDPNNPTANRTLYLDGGSSKNFPYFMAADLTDYLSLWENGTQPFFLKIGESSTGTASVASGFWIEYYPNEYKLNNPYRVSWPSPDAPLTTPGYLTNRFELQNDLSDLEISSANMSISPSPVLIGNNITLTFTVFNRGVNTSYNVSVAIYRDRLFSYYKMGETNIGDIPPGGNVTAHVEITTTRRFFGEHKIIVCVDPHRQVSELNESNNIANITLVGVRNPSAPRAFSLKRGDGYVLLTWNEPSDNGGLPVVKYNIYRNGEKIAEVDNATFSYNDSSVNMKESYTYAVSASNPAGEGAKSYELTVSWNAPDKPENLQLRRGDGYVVLTWNAPQDDGGTKVSEYRVYRNSEMIASTTQLTYNDSSVNMRESYVYYVTAINAVGESNKSNEVSVAWQVPSEPQNLQLVRGDGTATLTWNAPQDDGGTRINAYNIYRDGKLIATIDGSSTTYKDENVDVKTEHTYYVTAVNAVGESNKSNEVSVAWQKPSQPLNVRGKEGSGGTLLTWDPPQDDGGTKIIKYEIYVEENGKWKLVGETENTKYNLKLSPTLTGGTTHVKIVPVNGVGEGEATVIQVKIPVNMVLWGAIIGVIIVIIAVAIALVKRKS